MSMKPKEIHPEHQKLLDSIGDACKKTAKLTDINQYLGSLHRIRLMVNNLHNAIVKEEK